LQIALLFQRIDQLELLPLLRERGERAVEIAVLNDPL